MSSFRCKIVTIPEGSAYATVCPGCKNIVFVKKFQKLRLNGAGEFPKTENELVGIYKGTICSCGKPLGLSSDTPNRHLLPWE